MGDTPLPRWVWTALRVSSLLAPRARRERWIREWSGELAHWCARPGRGRGRAAPGPARRLAAFVRVAAAFPSTALQSVAEIVRLAILIRVAASDALHLRRLHRERPTSAPRLSPPSTKATPMFRCLLQDLRFALRTVRGAPWLSSVTVVTLALGIGAGTAMVGLLDRVFLRPLPFAEAERLVVGRATVEGELNPWVSGADYVDYREESDAFRELAAVLPFPMDVTLSGGGDAERVAAGVASEDLLAALEVRPVLGRGFLPADGLPGAGDVVLLSHGLWERRLGSDPRAVGSTLMLEGAPYTVVGVLPRGFHFLQRADLWLPWRPDRYAAAARDAHNWYLVGRLKDGTTLDQAQAGVDLISARLEAAYPESNRDKALLLTPLRHVLTQDYRGSLGILSGAAALLLLIACANGAGILLARAPARRFELSVRAAMGAARARLVRQLLAESVALALVAGLVGATLAMGFQRVLLGYLRLERLGVEGTDPFLPTLAAALGVSLLAGLLAGVYPALRTADRSLTEGLRAGGRGGSDGGTTFRSGLVVLQVALSVTLLAGSGLLVRSLRNLEALNPGFRADGLLTAEVQLPNPRYPAVEDRHRFFSSLLDEIRALPGVEAATLTSHLPIGDQGNIYRANAQGREGDPERVFLRGVFPGSFELLGIPLVAGRDVDGEAEPRGPYQVVLGRTAARRLFPGEEPLGKAVELQAPGGARLLEVVGVVGDVRLSRLEDDPEAALYVPWTQHPRNVMRLAIRTGPSPESVAPALREVLRGLDPEVPLVRVTTLEALVETSMADRRVITLSLTLLATLPLLLASVGLFAILAYHVSRRRREMGVRMALGASATRVGAMVLKQGAGMVGIGVAAGVGGAAVGTRVLQGMLFGVEAGDPGTFLGVAGTVAAVALLACSVPVWRAARSDPRTAMEAD